jgi:hypothetical protein
MVNKNLKHSCEMKIKCTLLSMVFLLLGFIMTSCNSTGKKEKKMTSHSETEYKKGTYGYDVNFFNKHHIDIVELKDAETDACVMLIPAYQGRVMTSSASGNTGSSFGWINYKFIESGKFSEQFNPFGGEERFWLGPEGGPFSIYFPPGEEQEFKNWKVPSVIDTESFDISNQDSESVVFNKSTSIQNASGTVFQLEIERKVSVIPMKSALSQLGVSTANEISGIAYKSVNTIENIGDTPWLEETGLLSVWMLSMFNPTESTTVFIPYNNDSDGSIVNDDYFGKVPNERLLTEDGTIFFKIDGKYRSKIGIPYPRATSLCGSYDSEKMVLTLLWYNLPENPHPYVNSKWGPQEDPYNGDVVNSYNDGPVEDGSVMGPFYEIETSSPGAALQPHEALKHSQLIVHLQGEEKELSAIVSELFDLELADIKSRFN